MMPTNSAIGPRSSRRGMLRTLSAWAGLGAVGAAGGFDGLRPRAALAGPVVAPSSDGVVDPAVSDLARRGVHGYRGRSVNSSVAGDARSGVPTSCLQCVAICGLVGYEQDGRIVKIDGNPHAPNNRGMICAKGQAGVNQVYDPDRILHPLVRVGRRGEGKWKRISMAEALDLVAFGGEIAGQKVQGLKDIYESDAPEEFMLHYGRSRIKGALNHFCKTGFGTSTIGNHTSICETGKWVAQELTIGKHYDINDAANSRYILVMGANVLEAHTSHSYLAQRVIDGHANGAKLVTLDVRLSNTAARSDEWIPVRAGTDLAFVLAMIHVAMHEQPHGAPLYSADFIKRWTNTTVEDLKTHYAPYTPEWASDECGVAAETIRRIAIEYASTKPATLITYRGFVGHYNGTYAEVAAKTLEAVTGNLMIKGGTHRKVSGSWADAYAEVAKKHKSATRKAKKLALLDGVDVHLPTHHVSQWMFENLASGEFGRPKLYMTYCWNGAYTCGDNARTREILQDESVVPFFVAVDVAMSETTELADLILPDATFLERWTTEAPQSYELTKFLQLRQPVAAPLGEAMDMQDIFIQLARRIGGGIAELHSFDTAGEYVEACARLTAKKMDASGKPLYGVDGKPVSGDIWQYLREYGVLWQSLESDYMAHEHRVSDSDLKSALIDPTTKTVWNPAKAKVSPEDARTKGYRGSKKAYKGYVGQVVEGVAYKGFKPDKFNKSGLVEIRSEFLAAGADLVWRDLEAAVREDETFLADHLRSGFACWVPIPEHRMRSGNELVLISFKVNVQIHSRSQNCKWLQEIHHQNPLWLHPKTAQRLLGDIDEGDLVSVTQAMPTLPGDSRQSTAQARTVTARVHLTEAVHPDVVALSFHCGHWAYGRYASGSRMSADLTGSQDGAEEAWWQEGQPAATPETARDWSNARGVHPNWIIPNTPARVSGQFRSNDTLVEVARA